MYARHGYIYTYIYIYIYIILVMRVVHVQNHANVGNLNSHFWDLNWRYLPYTKPKFQGCVREGLEIPKKIPWVQGSFASFSTGQVPLLSGTKRVALRAHLGVTPTQHTASKSLEPHQLRKFESLAVKKNVTPGTVRRSTLLSSN